MKSIVTLADELGVTPAIMRSWQINLNLPRHPQEEAIYDEQWQQFFAQVAEMRRTGHSFSKIRDRLAALKPHELHSKPSPSNSPASPRVATVVVSSEPIASEQALVVAPTTALEVTLQQELRSLTQTYTHMVESYQALASRYSESTYRIGQLEQKNRSLESQIQDISQKDAQKYDQLQQQFENLSSQLQQQSTHLQQQSEKLATQDTLSQLERQLQQLTQTLTAPPPEPPAGFWKKFKKALLRPL